MFSGVFWIFLEIFTKLLTPINLFIGSILLGGAVIALPVVQIDVRSANDLLPIKTATATMRFGETKAVLRVFSSECSAKIIKEVNLSAERYLDRSKVIGWMAFSAQVTVWLLFLLSKAETIKYVVPRLSFATIALILLVFGGIGCCFILLVPPPSCGFIYPNEVFVQKVRLVESTLVISLMSFSIGIVAVLPQFFKARLFA